ncbi:MAG: 4-hydroxythreonine-4-phosphate dehydrogenase PdxA [Bacteroidales bacterium]|nr:4-hydroxythreonine-4-phosphate dehydrogenase PdxA [Bacteroidales bacterium]MDD2204298.1 4-hydroxythreonine-4-phosphate dehydrogenase PdxA [Bacteroidales bacterium]MDD3151350.1 4-hydroxythreonine-4-phosphate dehydrogenase PdxA [Bacteroidales bacterium]MDD3913179.1 4-hydroxythreonine-4-phosphate dehydrogenase PdxA [Bacteroidales bacterium]MDD4633094.1 4-hydroxythreonine-4-phosphate dehydrogenase PdxA [Bacteroidales bacterium]
MKINDYNSNSLKIGITQGDFNGVSYEIVINTLIDTVLCELLTPVFFGTSKLVSYFRKLFNAQDFSFQIAKSNDISVKKPNLINIFASETKVAIGTQTSEATDLAILSLEAAYEAVTGRNIDAIVCCPISPGLLKDKLPTFTGNGSFFVQKLKSDKFMRILCNDNVRIACATDKVEISNIKKFISQDVLLHKIISLNNILKNDFMINMPKIAILAVNPVNENGTFVGGEEEHLISAAVSAAASRGVYVFGPYDAMQLFQRNDYKAFDAIMAVAEQQANTVFSLLNGKDGIIYTAGLPFVITEPAHGAMYEIAGKNIADCQAFRNALYYAKDLTLNRRENYRLRKNALQTAE